MKLTDLINKLTEMKETRGDLNLSFTVKDYYSIHGDTMTPNWKTTDKFWEGCFTTDEHCTMFFSLEENEIEGVTKYPKITFRK